MEKTFNEQVYDVVARIPYGRVATFGQIAKMIGRPRMARFVGYASNNKASWHLPWHRVVFKDGTLCSGFADEQYKTLKSEIFLCIIIANTLYNLFECIVILGIFSLFYP